MGNGALVELCRVPGRGDQAPARAPQCLCPFRPSAPAPTYSSELASGTLHQRIHGMSGLLSLFVVWHWLSRWLQSLVFMCRGLRAFLAGPRRTIETICYGCRGR